MSDAEFPVFTGDGVRGGEWSLEAPIRGDAMDKEGKGRTVVPEGEMRSKVVEEGERRADQAAFCKQE